MGFEGPEADNKADKSEKYHGGMKKAALAAVVALGVSGAAEAQVQGGGEQVPYPDSNVSEKQFGGEQRVRADDGQEYIITTDGNNKMTIERVPTTEDMHEREGQSAGDKARDTKDRTKGFLE